MLQARLTKIPWLLGLAACALGLATIASDKEGRQEIAPGFPNISYQVQTAAGLTVTVIPASKHDLSPPLRDLVKIPSTLNLETGETEVENRVLPKYSLAKGTEALGERDAALQAWQGPEAMPNPIANWEGINNLDGVLPPDPTGAVGPNHIVQWVNLHMAIWDRNGTLIGVPFPGNTIWLGFGGPCDTCNDGDPVVLYDRLAERWVISQFALPNYPSGPFYQYVAVSQTSDPTGSWYRYVFTWSNTKMNDYPKLGVWPDGYYMTANQFIGKTWAGAGVAVMDRAKMLLGYSSATIQYIDLYSVDPNFGGMLPCDVDGPAPPAGAPAYFGEVDDSTSIGPSDAFRIWQFHVDWGTPASTTFGSSGQPNQVIPVASFTPICTTSGRNCIPQPGTTRGLDAIGDRLMFRLQYRNFGTYQTLVTNHTVDAGGGKAGVRWYELRNSGSGWSMYQQGTYAPDSDNRWMGSAAMNSSGAIAVGYSVSSSTTYPSIRYAGRVATDPSGELSLGETTLIAGNGSQTDSSSRWGDYSTLSLDPNDDCTFWYTQEYMATTSSAGWQTRIGAFQIVPTSVPAIGTATVPGDNQIAVTWTAGATPGATFNIYRAVLTGSSADCSTGIYTLLASGVAAPPYTDSAVSAGVTYGYRVSTVDSTTACESAQSGCVKATATGSCLTPPTFGGLTSVTPVTGTTCSLQLAWAAGTSNCGGTITYNVYRNTGSAPVPPTGLIQSGLTGTTYTDASLTSGTTYYYIVQAVDSANGMSDGNTTAKSGTPGSPAAPMNLVSDGFEANFSTNWPQTVVVSKATNGTWTSVTSGTSPTMPGNGNQVPEGTHVAMFNSHSATSGAQTRMVWGAQIAVPSSATAVALTFLMFHDTGSSGSADQIQLQVSTDNLNWSPIGSPITRYNSISSRWQQHSVDLSAYVGQNIYVAFLGSSAHGNNMYLDEVALNTNSPLGDKLDYTYFSWASSVSSTWYWAQSDGNVTGAVPHSGNYMAEFNSYNLSAGTTSLWESYSNGSLLSYSIPAAAVSAALSFYMYHDTSYSTRDDTMQPELSANGGTTWTSLGTVHRYDGSTGWKLHSYDVSGYKGQTVNVGFLGTSGFGNDELIEDVSLTFSTNSACTSCAVPSSLANNTATDINPCAASGVQVTWSLDPGNWGDVSGTRTYDVLRDGTPVQSGIPYGTNSTTTVPPDGLSHTYAVRYNNSCGLSATTAGAGAADASSSVPTITGASTNTCPATSVTLTTEPGMSGYQWYLDGNPIGGATSNAWSASASGTYTVSYTDGSGCSGTSAGHPVTIIPVPSAPTASNSGPICAGSTLYLFASAVPGATYAWAGPNGFISSLQNPSIPNATTAAAGLYSVTATVAGCASAAGTTTVTVNAIPASPTFVSALPVPDLVGAQAQHILTLANPVGSSMPSSFAFTWDPNFTVGNFGATSPGVPLGFWQEMRPYGAPYVPTAFYPIVWSGPNSAFVDVNGNGAYDPPTDYAVSLSGHTVTVSRTVSPGAVESQLVGYRLILQSALIQNPVLVGDYAVTATLSLACGGWSGQLSETITTSPSGCPLSDVGDNVRLTKSGDTFTISWDKTTPSGCQLGYGVFASTDCKQWGAFGPFAAVDNPQMALPPASTGVAVTYILVAEVGSDGLLGPLGHYGQ